MGASRSLKIAFCTLLAVSTIVVYRPVLFSDFISFDDGDYVFENRAVLTGLSWNGWWYAWTSIAYANWHPLTWLSLELDGSFWHRNPTGYHATNLVFHVVNSVLIYAAFFAMTKRFYCCAMVAALFALHPLHVESVAWVSERKDVLSTFFLLITLLAYRRYAARPSILRYLVVMAFLTFGLLSKPMLVTLPILLLLLDGWPLNRIDWGNGKLVDSSYPLRPPSRAIIEKTPLLMLAFVDGIITILVQTDAASTLKRLTIFQRVANALNGYLWYLQKTFLPTNLIAFYLHPEGNLSWIRIATGAVVLLSLTCWALWRARSHPHRIVGWAWFLVSLLPVIGLLQVGVQAYADRYSYIPHIGLFVLIVWETEYWLYKLKSGPLIGGVIALATIGCFGVMTHNQVSYWKNSKTLWTHLLDVEPRSSFAHLHLADAAQAEGDHEQAIFHIQRGLELDPIGPVANAYCNWGRSLVALGRLEEAEKKFRLALAFERNHVTTLEHFANLLRGQGRSAEAAQFLALRANVASQRAVQNSNTASGQFDLGVMQAQRGNYQQAIVHFEATVQLDPYSAMAYNNLGTLQIALHQFKEARANFVKALQLDPELGNAHYNLAKLLQADKDWAGARKHFHEAIRINPKHLESKQSLERLPKE